MKWKDFAENQRHYMRKYQDECKGRDVEFGRYCGRTKGITEVLDREETDVDPLQMAVRPCPGSGVVVLSNFMPDCYTILHGSEGCAYILKVFTDGYMLIFQEKGNIVTTAMNRVDAILGGEGKLREAILEVDRDHHPKIIMVIKSCAPTVIGDDIKGVCRSLKDQVSCKLVPVDVSSFGSRHCGLGRNEWLEALGEEFIKPSKQKIPNMINFIGDNCALHPPETRPLNDPEELERVMTAMGVKVHCRLPGRDSFDKLATFTSASLNVLVCGAAGLEFAKHMKEHYGMPYVTANRPIGVQNTTQLYLSVIEALGLGDKAMEVLHREVKEAEQALEPYRQKLTGKRFGVSLASGRFVGQVLMGMELGMEPVLLILHSLHEKVFAGLEILTEIFAEKGYDPEFITEANFYEEAELLDRIKPDVWYIDGTEKGMSIRFGIPYVNSMAETFSGPQMGYKGSLFWADQTLKAVESAEIFRKVAAPNSRIRYQPEKHKNLLKGE